MDLIPLELIKRLAELTKIREAEKGTEQEAEIKLLRESTQEVEAKSMKSCKKCVHSFFQEHRTASGATRSCLYCKAGHSSVMGDKINFSPDICGDYAKAVKGMTAFEYVEIMDGMKE
jgi:hypothetical protein